MADPESIFARVLDPALASTGSATAPPRPEDISKQVGIPLKDLVRLSANEAPLGPSPLARAAIVRAASSPDLHRYPDRRYIELKRAIARFVGVAVSQVLPTAGASEVLPLALRAFCGPGSRVAYVHPGIPRVGREATQRGLRPHRIDVESPYDITVDSILQGTPSDTRLLFITSPNNTTSRLVAPDVVATVARELSQCIVFVDEHYVEAADDVRASSAAGLVGNVPNIVVARTFSKIFGMAGMRAGYALASNEAVRFMGQINSRWPISVPAELAALAALGDIDHLEETRRVVSEGRTWLLTEIASIEGLSPIPQPQGNFVLVRTEGSPREVMEGLWKHGVLVNGFLHPGHIRVTVGTPGQNQQLVAALSKVMPQLRESSQSKEVAS